MEPTIAVQIEDGRPWMHETIIGYGAEDHNERYYRIRVTKSGHAVVRKKRHMKTTPILAEDNLRNEMSKSNIPQTEDQFNEFVDCFAQLYKHRGSNVVEMERKNKMANTHTIQPSRYMKIEHSETIRQKGNRIKHT